MYTSRRNWTTYISRRFISHLVADTRVRLNWNCWILIVVRFTHFYRINNANNRVSSVISWFIKCIAIIKFWKLSQFIYGLMRNTMQNAYLLKSRMRRRRAGVDILIEHYLLEKLPNQLKEMTWLKMVSQRYGLAHSLVSKTVDLLEMHLKVFFLLWLHVRYFFSFYK